MIRDYPTSETVSLIDAVLYPPPSEAKKLLVLTKFGILTVGTFDPNTHVAWALLPKIPATVKERMCL